MDYIDCAPGSVQGRSLCPEQKVPLAVGTMGGSPSTERPVHHPITGPTSVLHHHCRARKANLPLAQGLTQEPWSLRAQATQEEAMSCDHAKVFFMASSKHKRTSGREPGGFVQGQRVWAIFKTENTATD